MSVRARKVARDLLGNKARTALVVVAIAIGLVGLSTTLRARAIFSANLEDALAAANPASATILVDGASAADASAVAAHPDVSAAEGVLRAFGRIEIRGELRPLQLTVVDDLAGPRINRLRPEAGEWPAPGGTMVIERSSLDATGLAIGDTAVIEDPTAALHELRVAATVYDATVVSGRLVDQITFGYLSMDTWESLGLPPGFNEIALAVVGEQDPDRIAVVATEAARGLPVLGVRVPEPGKHVLDSTIASLLLILGSLGLLSLLLSGFLVFNTVAATMARQVPQIGVMKAIGGSRRELLAMYLGTIAVYGGLALLVAIPLGWLGARVLTTQLGTLLNIDIFRFGVPAWVWAVELAAGLLVPLLAALGPVLAGTRSTVAEAIRGGAGAAEFGTSRVDQALTRLRGLPGSVSYAARNVFRRKLRLALTVLALSLGGAILVTVVSLRSSLLATVDDIAAYWQQDVTVDLQQPLPFDQLAPLLPGDAEGWLVLPAAVVRPGGAAAGEETVVFGIPPDSRFIDPTLLDGRWLEPGDTDAVVVNVDVAANEPDLGVGGPLTLRVQGADVALRIVGEATTQLVGPGVPRPETPIAYLPYDTLADALGVAGSANRLAVAGDAAEVEDALLEAGFAVRSVETRERLRTQVERLTNPILLLLAAMAVVFALVGGIGLLGTMSLNALERTAEFGVVRAVGATGRTVLTIVLVEGVAVALLAFVLGSLAAIPLGWAMAQAVGISFIKVPLAFRFALAGLALWLAMAVVLAVVASWLPARNASRISVRDAIAYE